MLEIHTWWDRRVVYVSPLVELHPQSAYCLFKNFPNASHLSHEPTQLSVSLERLELLVGVRQSLQSFGLVDFVFEPCNLRLNSVIGVVPWSQKSHKTQVMVGPHAWDFNISSICHDPKIFKQKIFTKYSMVTYILKAGSQGTTSFPLSNPFPVGFASFWSNGPTPESCDLRWPHLTNTRVPCIHPQGTQGTRPKLRKFFWGKKKNNNGESSATGLLLQQLQEVATLLLTSPGLAWVGWDGLPLQWIVGFYFFHQHDFSSSSARPSSWLCWFTWSNGSCDAPESNCNICSWSSGFLFLDRNAA